MGFLDLDLVQLQSKTSHFTLEFNEVEKSRDLVKTAKPHVAFDLTTSAFSSS
jgi:hypothetical protein